MGIGNMISVMTGSGKEGTHLTRGKSGGNWERERGRQWETTRVLEEKPSDL